MNTVKKQRIGYKVVRVSIITNRMASMSIVGYPIEYQVRRWAHRPENGGPLCVFKTKEAAYLAQRAMAKAAKRIAEENGDPLTHRFEIWACVYQPSNDMWLWVPTDFEKFCRKITIAYLEANNKHMMMRGKTVLADRVFLYDRIV